MNTPFAVALLAVLSLSVLAEDPPAKIAALIDRACGLLESDDSEERQKGEDQLVDLGAKARPRLLELTKAGDPEVASRARSALKRIHENEAAAAVKLEIVTDKRAYRPGDEVRVELRARNTAEFDVVVPLFLWDGGPAARADVRLERAGRRVEAEWLPMIPQVMVHRRITEDRFAVLKPGASVVVRELRVRSEWDLKGADAGLKASYARASKAELKAGTYRLTARYSFDWEREPAAATAEGGFERLKWSFEGDSRRLFAEAWRGAVDAEAEFTVGESK